MARLSTYRNSTKKHNFIFQHNKGRIENTYTWDGTKRRRLVLDSYEQLISDECYYGDLVVENGQPTRILHGEGYVDINRMPVFNYHLKDHLGNVRAVISSSYGPGAYTLSQSSDYYPFGMALTMEFAAKAAGEAFTEIGKALPTKDIIDDSKTFTRSNAYLYNGKEEQPMPGKWLDYGARFYDAQLGRWHSVDPHAENYYSWSPFHYAANNPIIVTDPTGMDWYTSTDGSATMWKEGSNDIEGYTNIGANYTQDFGGGTSVTYTQNEATSMTFTGIEENNFVSQGTGTGCKVACDQMLANEGVNSNGERINVVNADENGVATNANTNATKGINAVDTALENGNPIEVGVDYKPKQVNNIPPNGDGMTDHFIVVSSKTETLSNGQVTSKSYKFFDPRSSVNGTSSSNTLHVRNTKITGHYLGGTASSIPYTVTTVRRSR